MTESNSVYTTRDSGAPAGSDEHSLTVGAGGPIVLHDHYLIEQMAQFNRERIPGSTETCSTAISASPSLSGVSSLSSSRKSVGTGKPSGRCANTQRCVCMIPPAALLCSGA